MSEAKHLAHVVENHFANPQTSIFAPFVSVTEGLTGLQAATTPRERFNSVWAVVNHIAFWQEVTRLGLLGQEIKLADWGLMEIGGGWPPLGEISDANWQAARQRALDTNHAFAQMIAGMTEEQLETAVEGIGRGWQAILAIYSHNSHHTSEILTIRHMLGLWVDHPWA